MASLDKGAKTPGDIKEMFNICLGSRQPAPDHPTPRWPEGSQSLQDAYEAYYRALEGLAATLYRVCALALGWVPRQPAHRCARATFACAQLVPRSCGRLPEDWFEDKIHEHRNVIRAINYPSQKPPLVPKPGQALATPLCTCVGTANAPGRTEPPPGQHDAAWPCPSGPHCGPYPLQVRASMHTDYGSLTILRLGGEYPGGLQVRGGRAAWESPRLWRWGGGRRSTRRTRRRGEDGRGWARMGEDGRGWARVGGDGGGVGAVGQNEA